MRGRLPKDPAIRQNRTRVSSRATLATEAEKPRRVPPLLRRKDENGTDRPYHDMTRRWWRDVWRSPMADEFLQADTHSLYRLAELIDAFWNKPTAGLAAEIRLAQTQFGLTPLDRRRLQWEVSKVEAVASQREQPALTDAPPLDPADDPRRLLHAV